MKALWLDDARQLRKLVDPYYWQTALIIAQSGVARQYRNSFLGVLWLLLPPLAMMSIYTLVMPLLLRSNARDYALYLLSTLPMWQFMANSFITASNSLIQYAPTLKRCMISSTIFPLSDVLKNTYSYVVGFTAMVLLGLALGLPISWHVLLWPLYFLPVLVSVISLSIGIAYCAPYVRDIGDAITIAMNMLLWVSAVVYPIDVLPEWARQIVQLNPLYVLLEPVITLVYHHQVPNLFVIVELLVVMCISLAVGYTLYRLGRRNYVYYL